MAEVVQLHIEDLLTGFKCLEDEAVFTTDEIQTIIKNIQNHEYKLQRSVKEKEISLKYINYLQCVLQLIQKRYDKMNLNTNEDVRHMFIKKIKTEFRKLRDKHQRDVKIWLSFINFCKRNNHKDYVGKLYNRMLQVLPDKPELWISAAKWFLEEQNSWDLARNSFKNGLRFNGNSPELYIEFFRFELLYIETILKRKQMLSEESNKNNENDGKEGANALYDYLPESHIDNDNILGGKIAMVIFKKAIEQIGIKYVTQFLEIIEDFSSYAFLKDLKTEIFNFMKENYADTEETWDILAKTCTSETNNHKRFKITDQEYQNALDKFSNEKMWSLYLDNLLTNLRLNIGKKEEQFYLSKLDQELKKCFEENLINKSTFIRLIEQLNSLQSSEHQQKIVIYGPNKWEDDLSIWQTFIKQRVIKYGLDKWENDSVLWQIFIKLLIKNNGSKIEIKNLFNKVMKIVSKSDEGQDFKKDFVSFVEVFTKWAINNLTERELIKILETNCIINVEMKDLTLNRKIVSYFKPILLEQISKFNDGQIKRRKMFEKYKLMNPIIKEFYLKMIELEIKENLEGLDAKSDDIKLIRRIFEELLSQFGKDDHKLWLNFCEFELNYGSYTEISRIYEIAKKQLNPVESDLFVQNYSLLHRKISI